MIESVDSSTLVSQPRNRVNDTQSLVASNHLVNSVLDQEQLEDKIENLYKQLGGFGKF